MIGSTETKMAATKITQIRWLFFWSAEGRTFDRNVIFAVEGSKYGIVRRFPEGLGQNQNGGC